MKIDINAPHIQGLLGLSELRLRVYDEILQLKGKPEDFAAQASVEAVKLLWINSIDVYHSTHFYPTAAELGGGIFDESNHKHWQVAYGKCMALYEPILHAMVAEEDELVSSYFDIVLMILTEFFVKYQKATQTLLGEPVLPIFVLLARILQKPRFSYAKAQATMLPDYNTALSFSQNCLMPHSLSQMFFKCLDEVCEPSIAAAVLMWMVQDYDFGPSWFVMPAWGPEILGAWSTFVHETPFLVIRLVRLFRIVATLATIEPNHIILLFRLFTAQLNVAIATLLDRTTVPQQALESIRLLRALKQISELLFRQLSWLHQWAIKTGSVIRVRVDSEILLTCVEGLLLGIEVFVIPFCIRSQQAEKDKLLRALKEIHETVSISAESIGTEGSEFAGRIEYRVHLTALACLGSLDGAVGSHPFSVTPVIPLILQQIRESETSERVELGLALSIEPVVQHTLTFWACSGDVDVAWLTALYDMISKTQGSEYGVLIAMLWRAMMHDFSVCTIPVEGEARPQTMSILSRLTVGNCPELIAFVIKLLQDGMLRNFGLPAEEQVQSHALLVRKLCYVPNSISMVDCRALSPILHDTNYHNPTMPFHWIATTLAHLLEQYPSFYQKLATADQRAFVQALLRSLSILIPIDSGSSEVWMVLLAKTLVKVVTLNQKLLLEKVLSRREVASALFHDADKDEFRVVVAGVLASGSLEARRALCSVLDSAQAITIVMLKTLSDKSSYDFFIKYIFSLKFEEIFKNWTRLILREIFQGIQKFDSVRIFNPQGLEMSGHGIFETVRLFYLQQGGGQRGLFAITRLSRKALMATILTMVATIIPKQNAERTEEEIRTMRIFLYVLERLLVTPSLGLVWPSATEHPFNEVQGVLNNVGDTLQEVLMGIGEISGRCPTFLARGFFEQLLLHMLFAIPTQSKMRLAQAFFYLGIFAEWLIVVPKAQRAQPCPWLSYFERIKEGAKGYELVWLIWLSEFANKLGLAIDEAHMMFGDPAFLKIDCSVSFATFLRACQIVEAEFFVPVSESLGLAFRGGAKLKDRLSGLLIQIRVESIDGPLPFPEMSNQACKVVIGEDGTVADLTWSQGALQTSQGKKTEASKWRDSAAEVGAVHTDSMLFRWDPQADLTIAHDDVQHYVFHFGLAMQEERWRLLWALMNEMPCDLNFCRSLFSMARQLPVEEAFLYRLLILISMVHVDMVHETRHPFAQEETAWIPGNFCPSLLQLVVSQSKQNVSLYTDYIDLLRSLIQNLLSYLQPPEGVPEPFLMKPPAFVCSSTHGSELRSRGDYRWELLTQVFNPYRHIESSLINGVIRLFEQLGPVEIKLMKEGLVLIVQICIKQNMQRLLSSPADEVPKILMNLDDYCARLMLAAPIDMLDWMMPGVGAVILHELPTFQSKLNLLVVCLSALHFFKERELVMPSGLPRKKLPIVGVISHLPELLLRFGVRQRLEMTMLREIIQLIRGEIIVSLRGHANTTDIADYAALAVASTAFYIVGQDYQLPPCTAVLVHCLPPQRKTGGQHSSKERSILMTYSFESAEQATLFFQTLEGRLTGRYITPFSGAVMVTHVESKPLQVTISLSYAVSAFSTDRWDHLVSAIEVIDLPVEEVEKASPPPISLRAARRLAQRRRHRCHEASVAGMLEEPVVLEAHPLPVGKVTSTQAIAVKDQAEEIAEVSPISQQTDVQQKRDKRARESQRKLEKKLARRSMQRSAVVEASQAVELSQAIVPVETILCVETLEVLPPESSTFEESIHHESQSPSSSVELPPIPQTAISDTSIHPSSPTTLGSTGESDSSTDFSVVMLEEGSRDFRVPNLAESFDLETRLYFIELLIQGWHEGPWDRPFQQNPRTSTELEVVQPVGTQKFPNSAVYATALAIAPITKKPEMRASVLSAGIGQGGGMLSLLGLNPQAPEFKSGFNEFNG